MNDYLLIMYNYGDNARLNMEFDFLDTPPAQKWRNMLEHTVANPKDNPLETLELAFCRDAGEAANAWSEIRRKLNFTNLVYLKMPFKKLSSEICSKLMDALFNMVNTNSVNGLENTTTINTMLPKLKQVMFYFDHIHDPLMHSGNEGTAFGHITQFPDPHFAIEWDPSWNQHLTTDIEFGTLYAELLYNETECYANIMQYDSTSAANMIRDGKFGAPSHIGSGYYIPFLSDLHMHESDLLMYMWSNLEEFKQANSSFDPIRAIQLGGRVPVAKLRTPLGSRGFPSYETLSSIQSTFKMEILEDYDGLDR